MVCKCVDVRGDHGAVQATLQHGDLVIHRAAGQDVNWNEFITSIFEGYVLCLEKKNPWLTFSMNNNYANIYIFLSTQNYAKKYTYWSKYLFAAKFLNFMLDLQQLNFARIANKAIRPVLLLSIPSELFRFRAPFPDINGHK